MIEELSFNYKQKASVKGLDFIIKNDLARDNSSVKYDKVKLIKVLKQLLDNAIKYTSEGSIEFGYKIESDNLKFYVKDSGIGINPTSINSIFERFTQGDKTFIDNLGGLGLGLSIAKELSQLLDGRIKVESELGTGSSFYFILPFNKLIFECYELNPNIKKKESYNIFVAEDEDLNYTFIEILFRK